MRGLFGRRLVSVVLVTLLSLGIMALPASDYADKLDPTLRTLVEKNENSLKERGVPLNLAPYTGRLEVHSEERSVAVRGLGGVNRELAGYTNQTYGETWSYGLGILVETNSPGLVEARASRVGTVAGDVVTAVADLGQVKRIARLPSVDYVQASRGLEMSLNVSVPLVGADKLHTETPVLQGEGVIVGVVDSGIDYDQKDFRVDRNPNDGVEEETSRISYIWDQVGNNDGGGPGPPPATFTYGTEYTKSEIEEDIADGDGPTSGKVRVKDSLGHGTHVSGVGAGDGSSNPNPNLYPTYRGMAPKSGVIMVKSDFTEASIIDGVNYVFRKAMEAGKPAVVNLSLGGHYGPHDGSSLLDRALDNLVGPGRLIVAAAGNEGNAFIHGDDTVSPSYSSTMRVDVTSIAETALTTWYPGESEFTVTVVSPGGESLTVPSGESKEEVFPGEGTVRVDNASGGVNPENGDKQIEIKLLGSEFNQSGPDVATGIWEVEVSAPPGTTGGRYDSWLWTSAGSIQKPVGNNHMSIASPGTAEGVITAGASISKTTWMGAGGTGSIFSLSSSDKGNIAPFSSWGPTRDRRLKPEIVAPGQVVASTLSGTYAEELRSDGSYGTLATEDEKHVIMQGTSVSAPHVSGQLALMLEENPDLTPAEAEERLTDTADSDRYTSVGYNPSSGNFDRNVGPVENDTWGYGKMDSNRAARTIGFYEEELDELSVKLGPNPASTDEEVYVYYQLPSDSSEATFEVFNAGGREVYSVSLSSDQEVHRWSLSSEDGEPLANGVYLYLIKTESRTTEVGKLIVENK